MYKKLSKLNLNKRVASILNTLFGFSAGKFFFFFFFLGGGGGGGGGRGEVVLLLISVDVVVGVPPGKG